MDDRAKLMAGIIERLYGLDESQLKSVYIFALQKDPVVESNAAAYANFYNSVRQLLGKYLPCSPMHIQNLYKTEGCANVF